MKTISSQIQNFQGSPSTSNIFLKKGPTLRYIKTDDKGKKILKTNSKICYIQEEEK